MRVAGRARLLHSIQNGIGIGSRHHRNAMLYLMRYEVEAGLDRNLTHPRPDTGSCNAKAHFQHYQSHLILQDAVRCISL
jgi:hypothetical protein